MRITLLALSDWCRLFAFKTGNPYSFFTSLSYWWLTKHDERNMSCVAYRQGDWRYTKNWNGEWQWLRFDSYIPDDDPAMSKAKEELVASLTEA